MSFTKSSKVSKGRFIKEFGKGRQQTDVDDAGKVVQLPVLVDEGGAISHSTLNKCIRLHELCVDFPQVAFLKTSMNRVALRLTEFKEIMQMMKSRSCYMDTVRVSVSFLFGFAFLFCFNA